MFVNIKQKKKICPKLPLLVIQWFQNGGLKNQFSTPFEPKLRNLAQRYIITSNLGKYYNMLKNECLISVLTEIVMTSHLPTCGEKHDLTVCAIKNHRT